VQWATIATSPHAQGQAVEMNSVEAKLALVCLLLIELELNSGGCLFGADAGSHHRCVHVSADDHSMCCEPLGILPEIWGV